MIAWKMLIRAFIALNAFPQAKHQQKWFVHFIFSYIIGIHTRRYNKYITKKNIPFQ